MNYSDTERMQTYLEALGYAQSQDPKQADLIFYNSCSVRQKAEDRVFGELKNTRKIRKKNPKLIVAITGCMVRKSSSRYSQSRDPLFNRSPDLDIALRIEELPRLAALIRELHKDYPIQEIPEEQTENYFDIQAAHSSGAQAFVPISTGCDKFCTYCIVPYSRGREKSRPIPEIICECEDLVDKGYKEITLIGQTVDSYGLSKYDQDHGTFKDLPEGEIPFVYLLKQLDPLHKKGLKRLRFTSPHPRDISDQLIKAIANLSTLMPFLHLPVQAGHNDLLKRMNRPYKIEEYKDIIRRLREHTPDISISTDIIVGFCGETQEEFQAVCDLFREIEFDHAYLAQYSSRPGTAATRFMDDDISQETKRERWHILNNILKEVSAKRLTRFVGRTIEVLVESHEGGICTGKSEHSRIVNFPGSASLIGEIVPVKITGSEVWTLEGELV